MRFRGFRNHVIPLVMAALGVAPSRAESQIPDLQLHAALGTICPTGLNLSSDSLLTLHTRLLDSGPPEAVDAQVEIACLRGWLASRDTRSRESWLQPLGSSWRSGATAVAMHILKAAPAHPIASDLLAVLSADRVLAAPDGELAPYLRAAVLAGVESRHVLRSCSEVHARLNEFRVAIMCSHRALHLGVDSSYHLLLRAREAARTADTTGALRAFLLAVATARDSGSLASVTWHVRWFLWPDELEDWHRLPDPERSAWIERVLSVRDVRDGQPHGSRLIEHFNRLEFAWANFRLSVLPINRRRIMELAALPEGPGGGCDHTEWTRLRGVSCVMRAFVRWQVDIDDRGAVWLRFGPPERRRYLTESAGSSDLPLNRVRREVWRYIIDGQPIILQFESEQGDGTEEPTRLVPGVFRDFLCEVDHYRCTMVARISQLGVPPETVVDIRSQDEEFIREATTRDDNAPRAERHLRTVGQLLRLWHPRGGQPIALLPWAVNLKDLTDDRSAGNEGTIELVVRALVGASTVAREWSYTRGFRVPASVRDDAYLTGLLELDADHALSAWSLFAREGGNRSGRVFDTAVPVLEGGELALSDLIIGSERQGLSWDGFSEPVPLAPLGAVDRRYPVSLYFQVKSAASHDSARVAIAVYRTTRDREESALTVSVDGRVVAGLTEIRRELGLDRLDAGRYRLEVTITTPGGLEATRSSPLYIR